MHEALEQPRALLGNCLLRPRIHRQTVDDLDGPLNGGDGPAQLAFGHRNRICNGRAADPRAVEAVGETIRDRLARLVSRRGWRQAKLERQIPEALAALQPLLELAVQV